jgi:methyltransferase
MAMTVGFLILLGLVGVERLVELRISRRNQRELVHRGAKKIFEPHFRWMVVLHTAVLVCAAAEVLWLGRPFIPWLAVVMGALFVFSNVLRWWVIRTLGSHWNVQIIQSSQLGVVTSGPYRWIRHPNYVGVVLEVFSLPMIHTAWITALAATVAHCELLRRRLRLEDGALLSNPAYRAAMGAKPRFLPRLFS